VTLEGGALAYGGLLFIKHLYDKWRTHRFGIYGAWGVGKTTLDGFLSTPGEQPAPEDSHATQHPYDNQVGRYVAPPPTRKRVKYQQSMKLLNRTIQSTDLGGQPAYYNLWLRDMVGRDVEIVFFLIDHRHTVDRTAVEQQLAFKFIVDALVDRKWTFRKWKMRRKAKKYRPRLVALIGNKADLWLYNDPTWKERWKDDQVDEHPIFDPFRADLARLQRAGIPNIKRCISALRGWDVEETIYDCIQAKI
jgi:hypothetical protein